MITQKFVVDVDTSTGQIVGQPQPYTVQEPAPVNNINVATYINYGIGGGILLILVIAIFSASFSVKQQTVKVIQRFGKFRKIATAGLNFKLPFIDRVAGTLDLRVQQINAEIETKTKDNVFVTLLVAIQFYIMSDKAIEAFYKLDDYEKQIKSYVFDNVRSKVPTLTLDETFTSKEDIAMGVKKELSDVMADFGFGITTALVTDIAPDKKVKESMNEINAQTRLMEASKMKAEGNKILLVKNAEAEAESKALQGRGIADERTAILKGLEDSVKEIATATGISIRDVMQWVTMTQYFDTIRNIGDQDNTKVIFLPSSPAGMSTIGDEIRTAMMSAKEVDTLPNKKVVKDTSI